MDGEYAREVAENEAQDAIIKKREAETEERVKEIQEARHKSHQHALDHAHDHQGHHEHHDNSAEAPPEGHHLEN